MSSDLSSADARHGSLAPTAVPNLFVLSGHHLHITYSTSGFDGLAHLQYQDTMRSIDARGDEIEAVQTEAGMVVSITIARTVDAGSTSFSLLVPRVNLVSASSSWPVRTFGITTIHRFSIVPSLDRGQLDSSTITELHGSAQLVEF